jgi:hypothetical protein
MSTSRISTSKPSTPINEHPDYESLLEKIGSVFGDELDMLTPTQVAALNGLIHDRVKARDWDPGAVTLSPPNSLTA